jgi:hypothetical protein
MALLSITLRSAGLLSSDNPFLISENSYALVSNSETCICPINNHSPSPTLLFYLTVSGKEAFGHIKKSINWLNVFWDLYCIVVSQRCTWSLEVEFYYDLLFIDIFCRFFQAKSWPFLHRSQIFRVWGLPLWEKAISRQPRTRWTNEFPIARPVVLISNEMEPSISTLFKRQCPSWERFAVTLTWCYCM